MYICMYVYMANAFNNCDRHSFLNRLQRELPELYSWVLWCYHTIIGELRFGNCRLISLAGSTGRPLRSTVNLACCNGANGRVGSNPRDCITVVVPG